MKTFTMKPMEQWCPKCHCYRDFEIPMNQIAQLRETNDGARIRFLKRRCMECGEVR